MAKYARQHQGRRLAAAFFVSALLAVPTTASHATSPSPTGEVLTLSEAAELLRVDTGELETLASRSEIPARRIGSNWRFNRGALLAWLNGDWHLIAAIDAPGARPSMPSNGPSTPLPPQALEPLRAAGTRTAQATVADPEPAQSSIGEAPEEATAEDVFLRSQKILLSPGQVAVDFAQFYSRSDIPQLVLAGNGVTVANLKQSVFTTLLQARLGIADETELFLGSTFRHLSSDVLAGSAKLAGSNLNELGDVRLGVRRTLLTEGPGRPNIIALLDGRIPTGRTSYAVGGGFAVVKSFDPVALFASVNYRHAFSRDFSDITRLEPENRLDVVLGYAMALNDTLTVSTSISGLFSGASRFTNARLLQQEIYGLQLGLTSWLAAGLYIEPSVSFGLSGPGNSVAFGVTLPYSF